MISNEIKFKIKEHALQKAPEECCGLLVSKNKDLQVLQCANISKDKQNEFSINPKDYLKASLFGKIVGIYHSHAIQEESFSELDRLISHKLNLKNIVYIVKKDTFEEYSPENYYSKYIDVDFCINKSDCLTIVENYYGEEFGIKIFHHSRDLNWDKNYEQLVKSKLSQFSNSEDFDELIKKENFVKINGFENAKKHDVILFKYFKNYPSHFAIYLGRDYILHQPRNKKSIIEKLTQAEKRRVYCLARHQQLC